jgi:hypothetical protein
LAHTKEGMALIIVSGLTIYGLILFTANHIYKIKRGEIDKDEEE